MVDATVVEVLAEVLCATSAVLFTFIATFSRSPKAENIVQNIIFALLIAAAFVLWWLPTLGGELWGSDYLPRPLALFCVILAVSARMNIKGENVSFGANPHSIGRMREEE
jgi:drug/metabolite transporter (DMT)-like permease